MMEKIGNFLADTFREGLQQHDQEMYDEGRNDQFRYDIQVFVAALQDNKVNKEKIMDILYEYYEISDRGTALQIIEDSQQWRKKVSKNK